MKQLISATLTQEAGQVWESWPVYSEVDIGRSATLSMLMVDSGQLVLRQKANVLMIGHLRGNIATHRRRILAFLAENPHSPVTCDHVYHYDLGNERRPGWFNPS